MTNQGPTESEDHPSSSPSQEDHEPLDPRFKRGFWVVLIAYSLVGVSSAVLGSGAGAYDRLMWPLIGLVLTSLVSGSAFVLSLLLKEYALAQGIAAGFFLGGMICLLTCGVTL